MKFVDIDETKPDFFYKLKEFYKDKIIIGRKTTGEVLDYIEQKYGINYLTESDWTAKKLGSYHEVKQMVCRYDDLLIYELNPAGESQKYYKYHESRYTKKYPILIFYSKEKDILDANCPLLQFEIKIVQGIEKSDIDSHSAGFKDYLNSLYLLDWAMAMENNMAPD